MTFLLKNDIIIHSSFSVTINPVLEVSFGKANQCLLSRPNLARRIPDLSAQGHAAGHPRPTWRHRRPFRDHRPHRWDRSRLPEPHHGDSLHRLADAHGLLAGRELRQAVQAQRRLPEPQHHLRLRRRLSAFGLYGHQGRREVAAVLPRAQHQCRALDHGDDSPEGRSQGQGTAAGLTRPIKLLEASRSYGWPLSFYFNLQFFYYTSLTIYLHHISIFEYFCGMLQSHN